MAAQAAAIQALGSWSFQPVSVEECLDGVLCVHEDLPAVWLVPCIDMLDTLRLCVPAYDRLLTVSQTYGLGVHAHIAVPTRWLVHIHVCQLIVLPCFVLVLAAYACRRSIQDLVVDGRPTTAVYYDKLRNIVKFTNLFLPYERYVSQSAA